MRRILFGIAFVLHGLAHANAGMLAANDGSVAATVLWAFTSVAFIAAGAVLLGVRRLYRHWQVAAIAAVACSMLLLAVFRPATARAGLVVDVIIMIVLMTVYIPRPEWSRPHAGVWATIGRATVFAALAYVGIVIMTRPWHSRWGSSDGELRAAMPGDELVPNAHYTTQRAVTIHANPDAIWPWGGSSPAGFRRD